MVGGIHGEQSRAVSRSLKWVDVWTFEVDETPGAIIHLCGRGSRDARQNSDGKSRSEAGSEDLSRMVDHSCLGYTGAHKVTRIRDS
jgi:hypothetical protein